MRKLILPLAAFALSFTSTPELSAANTHTDSGEPHRVTAATIATDFFIVRPIALVSLIAAVPIATVVLPFSVVTGNGKQVAKELLGRPFHHTFRRHVGDFTED